MMKNIDTAFGLILILLCVYNFTLAQGLDGLEGQTNLQMLGGNSLTARTFDNRYDGVEGFPTLVKDFVRGRIIMNKNQVLKADFINYDVFNDEVFVNKSGKELIVSRANVQSFELDVNGTTLIFSKEKNAEGEIGYYQVLTSGNFSLFIKHKKVFRKADYQGAYSANRTKDEFTDEQKFYWSKDNLDLLKLKNKKSLLNELGDSSDKAEKFIKENNIKIDSQDDLLRLFQYLNESLKN